MVISLSLNNMVARAALLLAAAGFAALVVFIVASNFIIGTMIDYRKNFNRHELASPVYHFPNSARLHARLAEAELQDLNRDLANAELHAAEAIRLSPYDYRFPVILASVKEALGDRQAAGEQLRNAAALSPNNSTVRYRLANLLVREGRLEESIEEFRKTVSINPRLLPATIDLIWQASNNDVGLVEQIAGESPKAQMTLAQFLAKQGRAGDAARVFARIDRRARLGSAETPGFIKAMIDAGYPVLAKEVWLGLVGNGGTDGAIVWNGGFESDVSRSFGHFDWTIPDWATRRENNRDVRYARVGIDRTTAHTGSRSLKIEFTGENTTRLDGEIRQLIALRPGVRYRLECYAKSENLMTPEGPHVAIMGGRPVDDPSSEPASEPATKSVAAGSNDWQRLVVDFVAPVGKSPGQSSIQIAIKRIPKFSYDEPTRGIVWFDDFTIKEQ